MASKNSVHLIDSCLCDEGYNGKNCDISKADYELINKKTGEYIDQLETLKTEKVVDS
jgi:hypothetical protein